MTQGSFAQEMSDAYFFSGADVSAIIVGALAFLGVLGVPLLTRHRREKKSEDRKERENRLTDEHYGITIPHSVQTEQKAIDLAFQVSKRSEELEKRLTAAERTIQEQDGRFSRVEKEVKQFRKAYTAIYGWAQDVITRWDEHRLSDSAPALPEDAHLPPSPYEGQ